MYEYHWQIPTKNAWEKNYLYITLRIFSDNNRKEQLQMAKYQKDFCKSLWYNVVMSYA